MAELASMAMELLPMPHWNVFFTHPEEINRVKKEDVMNIINGLPWMAAIDSFQHWVCEHPCHFSRRKRRAVESYFY